LSCAALIIPAQLNEIAEETGLELMLTAAGVVKTGLGATKMGEEHIGFNSSTPYVSNFNVPGCGPEVSIVAFFFGTGGPLTATLGNPKQGSRMANGWFESAASQGCMAHHEWLLVSGGGRAVCTQDEHGLTVVNAQLLFGAVSLV
jgi:hypothetical protein